MHLITSMLTVSFGAAATLYSFLCLPVTKRVAAGRLDLSEGEIEDLPDRVELRRLDDAAARAFKFLSALAEEFRAEGFEDAGTHEVQGIPGAVVRLLAHPAQSMYCTIWEHSKAGAWVEFSCQDATGLTTTITTLTGSGFCGHAGQTVIRIPSGESRELYARACRERPHGVFVPASAAQAVTRFENGYSSWRASHGGPRHASIAAAA